jgi:hypothetical protein
LAARPQSEVCRRNIRRLAHAAVLTCQRHKLKAPLTPVTPESFAAWKKTRLEKKQAAADALEKAKSVQRAAGKMTGMTGRDMFEFGGELYADDEEEGGEDDWDISRMLARYVSILHYFAVSGMTVTPPHRAACHERGHHVRSVMADNHREKKRNDQTTGTKSKKDRWTGRMRTASGRLQHKWLLSRCKRTRDAAPHTYQWQRDGWGR